MRCASGIHTQQRVPPPTSDLQSANCRLYPILEAHVTDFPKHRVPVTMTKVQTALVLYFIAISYAPASVLGMRSLSKVRAISFDVTGTLLVHKYPIMDTYAASAVWAQLPNPPTSAELKPAFKKAYFKHLTESPCFGAKDGLSSRQW